MVYLSSEFWSSDAAQVLLFVIFILSLPRSWDGRKTCQCSKNVLVLAETKKSMHFAKVGVELKWFWDADAKMAGKFTIVAWPHQLHCTFHQFSSYCYWAHISRFIRLQRWRVETAVVLFGESQRLMSGDTTARQSSVCASSRIHAYMFKRPERGGTH